MSNEDAGLGAVAAHEPDTESTAASTSTSLASASTSAPDAAVPADTPAEPEATEKSSKQTLDVSPPRLIPATDRITLVKRGTRRYVVAKPTRLRNNLLGAVGLLELANAGDFAANVFNMIPVPVYAVVLMALGGTVAFVLSFFAFRDAHLSLANVRILREQRRGLRSARAERLKESLPTRDIDILLDVNLRELGTETISRCAMGLLMGCGAVIIAVGTWMAIDGADYKVWLASNLLSGYIGNTPLAVFGLVNAAWSGYIWTKAHRHRAAGRRRWATVAGREKAGTATTPAALLALKRRTRNVQIFAVVSGVTSFMGGAGSMITATMWWGKNIPRPKKRELFDRA